VRAEHESRVNEMVQLHDRQLQQLQSTTAAARQQDATTITRQLAALDTKYTATVTGLREALKQTRAKLKQLLSNGSGSTSSGTASYRGATTASSRARYWLLNA
jgi:beta-phosphoglucomutase-like phosphatase (HAD superfamily)